MQIRLTVLGPRSGHTTRACDVLVTAPAGTALAAVAGSLAASVASSGADLGGSGTGSGSGGAGGSGPVVLYAGTERLDPQRVALGEPPLIDGAVLSLQGPGPAPAHGLPHGTARLRVISGPDAGGVHLLHGGQIRIGRSADADVPLDDPDVSRLHCAVTVAADGSVQVADLRSTNGTAVDGTDLGEQPAPLRPGALLRIGESALRLQAAPAAPDPALHTTPDGEGRLRLAPGPHGACAPIGAPGSYHPAPGSTAASPVPAPRTPQDTAPAGRRDTPVRGTPAQDAAAAPSPWPDAATAHGYGAGYGTGPHREAAHGAPYGATDPTHGSGQPLAPYDPHHPSAPYDAAALSAPYEASGPSDAPGPYAPSDPSAHPRSDLAPRKVARRGGLGAWARRLTGARPAADRPDGTLPPGHAPAPLPQDAHDPERGTAPSGTADDDRWPDAAAVLLTALGPGPRLWERGPAHPDALTVRLGTASRGGGRAAVPVTVELRRAGSLGLAGPRARLIGLARAALAQLAALHSPGTLDIVLISADRARTAEERVADWSWLGWLPHVRPAHGQDCRLLLAHDTEQATARAAELVRRLDDGPLGPGWASAERAEVSLAAARHQGPYTLLIVDGDPGSSALRETTARLASSGAAAGIHLLCLAETPAASPAFPLASTYEAARAASPAFGECGAVAVLSGDVATALRVVQPGSGPNGTVAAVDAVSAAWADRFARALAPLREVDATTLAGGPTAPRAAVPLPDSARLLDELGLARATPASLMARWAAALDSDRPSAPAVLGAGPRGPVHADLAADDTHLLVEGAAATGKTELLRSLAASLAAADRPDLLSLVLVDGAGSERGEGLRACTDLPHVTTYLAASDPVRMRQFAQALSSELKRRAEILGDTPFAAWRAAHLPAPQIIAPRRPAESTGSTGPSGSTEAGASPTSAASVASNPGDGEQEPITFRNRCRNKEEAGGTPADPSTTGTSGTRGTLRLRARTDSPAGTAAAGTAIDPDATPAAPMPRLFVLVDDFDSLVAPALGSPGRPAAGSVVRALEAVAREGAALGVHLIVSTSHPDRTADTATGERAELRIELGTPTDPAEPAAEPAPPAPPGRGRLHRAADGTSTPFQAGRVTGRIPRTSTLRPTVVPLEWQRMGDPPARRPLRELGNGPTDLALLASALQRAAQSSDAPAPSPLV
ncbi:FtsK/SpoIIIE domain-containing protein [Streptomyces sp. NPDC020742]|uniref:FtsK/SpoIIIE domain-containing protein n=1 Tax=Streptomyces sp. NPDC020742 TaxID=3154897 RepID=UPI0033FC122F